MFRELIDYCVTACASSGIYSLSLEKTPTNDLVIVSFCSGNVLHRICLGTGPRVLLIPNKILGLVASFITLFESPRAVCVLSAWGTNLTNASLQHYQELNVLIWFIRLDQMISRNVLPAPQ